MNFEFILRARARGLGLGLGAGSQIMCRNLGDPPDNVIHVLIFTSKSIYVSYGWTNWVWVIDIGNNMARLASYQN